MAPPPRLVQFLAVPLSLSVVLLLLAVSGVHATRRHHHAHVAGGQHRVGIGGEMEHQEVGWRWSRTVVSRGGHGHGHGAGTGGTPFYPRTVTGHGHHRSSAAATTTGRPSTAAARALLLVVAAVVVLLLLRL